MSESTRLDQVRSAALGRIDRAERTYKIGILLVAFFEALFGCAFLLLMDFRDRSHWLILLAAVLAYGVILISVVNLGRYVNSATHTLLQAILTQHTDEGNQPAR